MVSIATFPAEHVIDRAKSRTPDYMHPTSVPCAVISEGFIPGDKCDEIMARLMLIEAYTVPKCGAITREIGHIPELDEIRDFALLLNDVYWGYDLDARTNTWLQTYYERGRYQLHMDAVPGQMRKLTAVTFLTDPDMYGGGDLEIFFHPMSQKIPRTRGTVVVFQPWILHEVHPITTGVRQSLNMGFWGPNFK